MPDRERVKAIPWLGAGLGYRRQMGDAIWGARDALDFLEVTTEHYMQHPRQIEELEKLASSFTCIPHGLRLSIGSALAPPKDYLRAIKRVLDVTKAPYYTDHLAITSAPGIDLGHLSPVWLTRENLEHVVRNVSAVQDFLGKLLVLETITYLFEIPGADMRQTDFFGALVERTGCGILLDATNLYTNAVNHNFSAVEFLNQMPLEHVVHVHMAGGFRQGNTLMDSHSHDVEEGSWEVLRLLAERAALKGVIVERDQNFPSIDRLLAEVAKARDIMSRKGGASSRTSLPAEF